MPDCPAASRLDHNVEQGGEVDLEVAQDIADLSQMAHYRASPDFKIGLTGKPIQSSQTKDLSGDNATFSSVPTLEAPRSQVSEPTLEDDREESTEEDDLVTDDESEWEPSESEAWGGSTQHESNPDTNHLPVQDGQQSPGRLVLTGEQEDLQVKLPAAVLRRDALERRKSKQELPPAEVGQLRSLNATMTTLDSQLEESTAEHHQDNPMTNLQDAHTSDLLSPRHQNISAQRSTKRTADKAHMSSRRGKTPATKRHKASSSKSSTRNNPSNRTARFTKELGFYIMDCDPETATDRIKELPVHGEFAANTVVSWEAELKKVKEGASWAVRREIKDDETKLREARVALGRGVCSNAGLKWRIKGIKTELFGYQVAGVGFMLLRERAKDGPKGGINADGMGLGKTLQSLTLITHNLPTPEEEQAGIKSTLIVTPSNAQHQWWEEVFKHCDDPSVIECKGQLPGKKILLAHRIV
jgi:hypothetical protein